MLSTALRQYQRQQRITAMGLTQARKASTRGSRAVWQAVAPYQAASASLSLEMAPLILAEQGIDSSATAAVIPTSLLTGPGAADLLDQAATDAAFERLVRSLMQDAGRTASAVANVTRPAVTGYVRYLNPPSCSRCAVLAGRVYRYSEGFLRHPRCDCQMHPTNEAVGPELISDPKGAFEHGQIRGLSQADTEALRNGADISQVVNVRRKGAGLIVGSSVLERAGRLTPEGILRIASTRAQQIELLRRFGYIT